MRPAEFAQDGSAHMLCVQHALRVLRESEGYIPDYLLILQPTSPFRSAEDIDGAIELAARTGCDSVLGLTTGDKHPCKMHYVHPPGPSEAVAPTSGLSTSNLDLAIETGGVCSPMAVMNSATYLRRQALPKHFAENGAIFLQRTNTLVDTSTSQQSRGSLASKDIRAWIMPASRSLDIDTHHDLRIARLFMNDLLSSSEVAAPVPTISPEEADAKIAALANS